MKNKSILVFRPETRAAVTGFLLASSALPASADTIYWDGSAASPGDWNTTANWSTASGDTTPDPAAKPGAADDVIFNITGENTPQTIHLALTAQAAKSLTFNSTGTTAINNEATPSATATNLSLGSGGLTIGSGAGAVSIGGGGAVAVNGATAVLTTNATITHNGASSLNFGQSLTTGTSLGAITLTLAGAGITEYTQGIDQASGTQLSLVVDGGRHYFRASSTLTNLTINGGEILSRGSGQFSSVVNTINFNGGAWASVQSDRSYANNFAVGGNIQLGSTGISAIGNIAGINTPGSTFSGTFNLTGGNRTITTLGTNTINGVISNGALTVGAGSTGTLNLGGANTYTGTTTVNGGTLNFTAGSSITSNIIVNGGTLGFTGLTSTTGNITVNGGTLSVNFDTGTATGSGNQTNRVNSSTPLVLGGGTVSILGSNDRAAFTGRTITTVTSAGTNLWTVASTGIGTNTVSLGMPITGTGITGGYVHSINGTDSVTIFSTTAPTASATNWAAVAFDPRDSQSFAGTTLNAGASAVATNRNGGLGTILNLGAITRNVGSTLRVTLEGTPGTTNGVHTSTGTASTTLMDNGVLYAHTATGFLSKNSTNVWFANDTTNANTATTLGSKSITAAGIDTTLADDATTVSMIHNLAEARTITATGFTITTGAVLVGSTGNSATGLTINGGTLRSAATVANKDLVLISTDDSYLTINSTITNAAIGNTGLTKSGTGLVTLGGANSYTGLTTVNQGTLAISATGSIANSSQIQINSSTTLNVSGVTSTFTLGAAQVLTGGGTILATGKTVNVAGTLAPGASPGTLTQDGGTMQLAVGGDYNWQIHDATGAAGTGYDTTSLINGATLDLSLLSAGNTFNINLWSLSSLVPDVNGNTINFNNAVSQAWTLFSTGAAIAGFSTDKFTINTSIFNGTNGFSNDLGGGAFSVGLADGNTDLVLSFTPIPEPNHAALIGGFGVLALLRRRRA